MKNISKKFLIIFIAFLLILNINLISNAEPNPSDTPELGVDATFLDEAQDPDEYEEDEDYTNSDDENVPNNSELEGNFFSITSNDVTLNQNIFGDVFICTSGTAKIDCLIAGNVFICAKNIEITENAQIDTSLFAFSDNLTILGNIYGNVYAASNNFKLGETGYINYDLNLTSKDTIINGEIYRNSNISGEKIEVSQNAYIENDFNYSSKHELDIDKSIVGGNINFINTTKLEKNNNHIFDWLYSVLSFVILAIVLFIIFKFINNKLINEHTEFTHNLGKYFLYGLLGLIVTPFVCFALLMLNVTINLAFILFAIYFILAFVASCITIIVLSQLLTEKLKEKLNINNTLLAILVIAILCIAYKLLQLIPFLGTLLTFLFVLFGFGIIIKSTLPKKQQDKNI